MSKEDFEIAKKLFPIEKGEFRYLGFPSRQKVNNWERAAEIINYHNFNDNCFISIASYNPESNLELVFFDMDGSQSLNNTYDLSLYFEKKKYIPYYIISSGNGYHILLKVKKEFISKTEYGLFYDKILSEIKLESFDVHVKGDINRMIRIPDTLNLKSGTICHFLDDNEYNLLDSAIISLKDEIKNFNQVEIKISNGNFDTDIPYSIHDFPCLEKKMMVREPSHIDRVLFTSALIGQGYSDLEIFNKLKSFKWIDLDFRITVYQIKYIRMNKYSPPTCRSLKKRGLCDHSCEIFRE